MQIFKVNYKVLKLLYIITDYNTSLLVHFRLLSKDHTEFFTGVIEKVVETRKKNNLSRADFLQNLISDKTEGDYLIDLVADYQPTMIDDVQGFGLGSAQ